jgi:hypothetical protein
MITTLVCPISKEKIDSYLSRITVFFNVLLMLIFIITLNPVFVIVVVVDYFIRAFLSIRLSPVRFFAKFIRTLIGLKPKYINLAPKIFAARLGFIFSFSALIAFATGYSFISIIIAAFLMTLSTLDSVFDFCLGCLVYNYLVFPFFNKQQVKS